MKILEIKLENFGPFVGHQNLDINARSGNPLIVVQAQNGRGKTFLYRAIRWALYGSALKDGRKIPDEKLFNTVAQLRGETQMSVSLSCESGDEPIEITRIVSLEKQSKDSFTQKLIVKRGGEVLSFSAAENAIRSRMDEQISRFFFFDGEMMGEYESLLNDDEGDARVVRNSIEAILGAPALQRLGKVLGSIEQAAMKEVATLTKADEKLQVLASKVISAELKVDGLESDLSSIKVGANDIDSEVRAIEDELRNFEHAREILAKIEAKEDEAARHRTNSERAMDEIRVDLQDWRVSLGSITTATLSVLEPLRDQVYQSVSERESLEIQLENIRASASVGACSICHQPVVGLIAEHLREESARIAARLEELSQYDRTYLDQILSKIKQAKAYANVSETASLYQKGRKFEALIQDVATLESEIERLQNQVIGVDDTKVRKLEEKRIELRSKKAVSEEIIRTKNADLSAARIDLDSAKSDLKSEQKKNTKKGILAGGPGEDQLLMSEVSGSAKKAIDEAYDDFVQQMRQTVNESANEIFQLLISDSRFQGLRINKNFGLSLLNENGIIVDLRSSGQSQVVAVSLILALHQCAVRSGTLLMDTPFGRLDLEHRSRMLDYFSHYLPQVVLLIQSGELDDDDLMNWAEFTTRRYLLERGNTTGETLIEEVL